MTVDGEPTAERFTLQFNHHRAGGGLSHACVTAGINPAGKAPAAGDIPCQSIKPDQPVSWQRYRCHRRASGNRNISQSPGAAGFGLLQQQIIVPACRVVRMASVLKQDEPGHGIPCMVSAALSLAGCSIVLSSSRLGAAESQRLWLVPDRPAGIFIP